MSRDVHETAPEELPNIRSMLESLDTNNIMVNTALVEALAAYDFLEPPVSLDGALSELRAVVAPEAASDPVTIEIASLSGVSADQFLSDRAYGLLSNIFEDVFQGVYYEAYTQLTDDEKRTILCLAANANNTGFFTEWVLRELSKHGGERVKATYERFASAPEAGNVSPQEAVASFVLGVEGCVKLGGTLPPYQEDQPPDIQAWRTIGEILFLCAREMPVPVEIWQRLTGQVGLAAADVFYQLNHSQWRVSEKQRPLDPVIMYHHETKPIIETCLRQRDSLSSIFQYGGSRDQNVVRFLISCLASIGDAGSISVLATIADDAVFGREALRSIEAIQRRLRPIGVSAAS